MQIALGIILILVSTYARADESERKGLCSGTEITYFACQTGKQKWIALCGAVPNALQYRFGRENHVEFRFPKVASEALERFLFAHYVRYQTDRTEVGFSNKDIDYAVFGYTENEEYRAGVRITTSQGKESEFVCIGGVTDRLNELKEVLRCNPDNPLNDSSCSP